MRAEVQQKFRDFLIHQRRCCEVSAQQYMVHIEKYEHHALNFGIHDILTIDTYPVAFEVLISLKTSGDRFGRPLSDSYIKKIEYMVSIYWQFAFLFGYRKTENPFKYGSSIRKPKFSAPRYFDSNSDELKQVLAYPRTMRDKALIWILFSSAVRTSEATNLLIDDVDSESIRIRNGKGNKDRTAPICPQTKRYIDAHLEDLQGRGYSGPWLFPRFDLSGPILPGTLRKFLFRMGRNLGLEKLYPRMLRHSFAARMLEAGAELYEVKEWMGHEDIRTTMIYTHPTQTHLRRRYRELTKTA